MVWLGQMLGATGNSGMGSSLATIMFAYAMFRQYFPAHLRTKLERYFDRLLSYVNPYIQITIHEYTGTRFRRSEAYIAVETYLGANSSKQAKRLKADMGNNAKCIVLSMADHEEVIDVYQGVQFWWTSSKSPTNKQSISLFSTDADDKRYYKLTCHRMHRGFVTDTYLSHVLEEGKAIAVRNRQRKIFTNNPSQDSHSYRRSVWSHVVFEHPSTFRTLAMEEEKKQDIIDDLTTFSKSKDYYEKIGKAWKRGYLLYGPPGTGKSTMIAAIADFLEYDIYDLELTAVKDNTGLRKLLIETSSKSIIVIEDIDCSLDLTGQRKKKEEKEAHKEGEDPINAIKKKEGTSNTESKVTLSGLLNFIDGLWSACGGERIIIFTTNYVDKLDPALIRRGRMDKHIEMSYCSFGAFKVLARNYLDLESHHLFETIKQLLEENQITPADVAESLMPKTREGDFQELCLKNLIQAIKDAKEEARLKAEEEARVKAEEEEAKLKAKEQESSRKGKEEADVEKSLTKTEAKENGSTVLDGSTKENGK